MSDSTDKPSSGHPVSAEGDGEAEGERANGLLELTPVEQEDQHH